MTALKQIGFALAVTVAAALSVSAATVVLQQGVNGYTGMKDAEIRDPSTNYDNGVYPREWPQRIAIVNTNYCPYCPHARGIIRFDLSSVIPPGATISSAKLDLYCVRINDEKNFSTVWGIYPLTMAWDDRAATWTRATGSVNWTAGGAIGAKYGTVTTPYGKNVWKSFDVRAAVSAFVADPSSNHGILITHDDRSSAAGQFLSSDNSDVALRPKLTIVYTGGTGVRATQAVQRAAPVRIERVGGSLTVVGPDAGTRVKVFALNGAEISLDARAYSSRVPARGAFVVHTTAPDGGQQMRMLTDY